MYYTVAVYLDVAGEDAENPSGNCKLSDRGGAAWGQTLSGPPCIPGPASKRALSEDLKFS